MPALPVNDKRRDQGEASKKLILEAATRLIAEHGYDGTSLSQIAKASGLPSGSIYWHFESKAGVLAAVIRQGAERFFAFFDHRPWFEGTPEERLRQAMLHTVRSLMAQPEHRQFLQIQLRYLLNVHHHPSDSEFAAAADAARAGGVEFMRRCVVESYLEQGRDFAEAAGAEVAEFGVLMVDGIFIALQNATDDEAAREEKMNRLIDQTVVALIGLIEDFRLRWQDEKTS